MGGGKMGQFALLATLFGVTLLALAKLLKISEILSLVSWTRLVRKIKKRSALDSRTVNKILNHDKKRETLFVSLFESNAFPLNDGEKGTRTQQQC